MRDHVSAVTPSARVRPGQPAGAESNAVAMHAIAGQGTIDIPNMILAHRVEI